MARLCLVSMMMALRGRLKVTGGLIPAGLETELDRICLLLALRTPKLRVLTWLKPIREARAKTFWKKYSFPLNV